MWDVNAKGCVQKSVNQVKACIRSKYHLHPGNHTSSAQQDAQTIQAATEMCQVS